MDSLLLQRATLVTRSGHQEAFNGVASGFRAIWSMIDRRYLFVFTKSKIWSVSSMSAVLIE